MKVKRKGTETGPGPEFFMQKKNTVGDRSPSVLRTMSKRWYWGETMRWS